MNERIQELACEAEAYADCIFDQGGEFHSAYTQKFAELIVLECMRLCRQEWYDLNNVSDLDIESREIAIRIGQKAATVQCMNIIARYFGVYDEV